MTNEELEEIKKALTLITPEPMLEDDTCSACYQTVKVVDGCEFENGDICDNCMRDFAEQAIEFTPKLIAEVERLREILKELCERIYSLQEVNGFCWDCGIDILERARKLLEGAEKL